MEIGVTGKDQRIVKALDTAIREAKTKPGMVMPNGATILQQTEVAANEWGKDYIVLAVYQGFQPYVVWKRCIGIEQKADGRSYGSLDYCVFGDYHRDLNDAICSYEKRING